MSSTLLISLLILALPSIAAGEDETPPKLTLSKLKQDLLRNYDPRFRPVKNSTQQVNVTITLIPRYLDFDSRSNQVSILTWFRMTWKDEFLNWDPAEYENHSYIIMPPRSIWVPDLIVHNRLDDTQLIDHARPSVTSNGTVRMLSSTRMAFHCSSNITRWPYDEHLCQVQLGSKTSGMKKLNFILSEEPVVTTKLLANVYWKTKDWSGLRKQIDLKKDGQLHYYVVLSYRVSFVRSTGVLTSLATMPAGVFSLLVLFSFWVDCEANERLSLQALALIGQLHQVQFIGFQVPTVGGNTVLIGTFARDCFLLCLWALLLTFMSRRLIHSGPVPGWLQCISMRVQGLTWIPKDNSLIEDPGEGKRAKESHKQEWTPLLSTLDIIHFVVFSLLYIVMVVSLIP